MQRLVAAEKLINDGKPREAEAACLPVLDDSPGIPKAQALLASGNWRAGWTEYDWRFRSRLYAKAMPRPNRPVWSGAPLPTRTLAVTTDQGFGDSFHFARYLPMAAARRGSLTVVCREPRVPLVSRIPGVARVVAAPRHLVAAGR